MKPGATIVLCVLFFAGCLSENITPVITTSGGADFANYWYQGKAELTSYVLKQARYGEIHEGNAVLIFVTEDFSKTKHVKLDDYVRAGKDGVKVLKLNLTKNFNTGIYPYSMMASIFTPVSGHPTLKVTTSSQEWCGHTFGQFNLDGDTYRIRQYSYFEQEGDVTVRLKQVLLEDEIWNRIRLNPASLPTGEISLIPGSMFQRLEHADIDVSMSVAQLETLENGNHAYTLRYPSLNRTLTIHYEPTFPYAITEWEETVGDLTTRATRDRSIMLDYWNHNSTEDLALRTELNLQ